MAHSCPSPLAHLAAFALVFGAGVLTGRLRCGPTWPPLHPASAAPSGGTP